MQPLVRFGQTSYLKPTYNRLKVEPNEAYTLPVTFFYEYGIRMEIATGLMKSLYFEYVRNVQNWDPDDFLRNSPHTDLVTSSTYGRVNIGYRFALDF